MFIPSGKASREAEWDYKYDVGIRSTIPCRFDDTVLQVRK